MQEMLRGFALLLAYLVWCGAKTIYERIKA